MNKLYCGIPEKLSKSALALRSLEDDASVLFVCLRHRIIRAERTRCVADQNVIAENLAVELHGLIHISNSYYSSGHSTGKLALVNEYLLVFHNLENISEKVLDIKARCAVRKSFRNCAVLPFC